MVRTVIASESIVSASYFFYCTLLMHQQLPYKHFYMIVLLQNDKDILKSSISIFRKFSKVHNIHNRYLNDVYSYCQFKQFDVVMETYVVISDVQRTVKISFNLAKINFI